MSKKETELPHVNCIITSYNIWCSTSHSSLLWEWDEWVSAPFWVQLLLCVTFDLIKKETTPCNCFLILSLSLSIIHSNYQQIQHLGYAGHEIATESISQQLGLQDKGYEEWVGEMIGMREILRHFANVSVNDVVGMRAPFLKPGRNTQYKVSTPPPSHILYILVYVYPTHGKELQQVLC